MYEDSYQALKSKTDVDTLKAYNPCDGIFALGSYWPESNTSFETRLVTAFKSCFPISRFDPYITQLCQHFAAIILDKAPKERFGYVARALGSSEKWPDTERPLSLLADVICRSTGARDITHYFNRTYVRTPTHHHDGSPSINLLTARLERASDGLLVRKSILDDGVLLLDDIFHSGATLRVYAHSLKEICKAPSVLGVSLSATRLCGGDDGLGELKLDTSEIERTIGLEQVWVDENSVFHTNRYCGCASGGCEVDVWFLAEKKATPCRQCAGGW